MTTVFRGQVSFTGYASSDIDGFGRKGPTGPLLFYGSLAAVLRLSQAGRGVNPPGPNGGPSHRKP